MTTRQREFCYHYASGLPAAKAAHAAGYAKSTCEHNAALMLRNPQIIATITQLSGTGQQRLMEIFEAASQSALHTLRYDSDERARQGASREMRGWARVLKDFKPNRILLPPLEESTEEESIKEDQSPVVGTHCVRPEPYHAGPPINHPVSQSKPEKPKTQRAKNQAKNSQHQQKITPEKDQLPNGQPAFDIHLSPQKPIPPPPQKQVIEVRNYIPKTLQTQTLLKPVSAELGASCPRQNNQPTQ